MLFDGRVQFVRQSIQVGQVEEGKELNIIIFLLGEVLKNRSITNTSLNFVTAWKWEKGDLELEKRAKCSVPQTNKKSESKNDKTSMKQWLLHSFKLFRKQNEDWISQSLLQKNVEKTFLNHNLQIFTSNALQYSAATTKSCWSSWKSAPTKSVCAGVERVGRGPRCTCRGLFSRGHGLLPRDDGLQVPN